MCGDGSNDAGALKIATIGVAMLNIKENKLQKKSHLIYYLLIMKLQLIIGMLQQ